MQLGFIAQEVREEFPELVSEAEELALNYAGLSVVAIGAVQDLHDRLENLEEENARLQQTLKDIQQALAGKGIALAQ